MTVTDEARHAIERAIADGRATVTGKPVGLRAVTVPTFLPLGYSLTIRLPVKVKSEMNQRDHWTARRRRFADQATVFLTEAHWLGTARPPLPCTITFTHRGRPIDGDNLQGAFKGLRDLIATWLRCEDDADPRLDWRYAQDKQMRPAMQGVEITFRTGEQHE